MSAVSSPRDDVHTNPKLWGRHCEAETPSPIEGELTGTIPAWLNGRLIRNGPGERYIGQDGYKHTFDGLAMLHMVNIKDGKATYCSKFLESETYAVNHKANRIVVSEFGTVGVPDPCMSLYGKFSAWYMPSMSGGKKYTDNCLINVLQVKDQLLAMTETNFVRVVDPETLKSPQQLDYTNYVSVQRATAHPHVEENGTVYNLGFSTSGGPPQYCIVSLDDGKIENAKIEASIPTRWKLYPGYMHSFGITENYYILADTPMCFDAKKIFLPKILKMSTFDCLKYFDKEHTQFRVISRKTNKEVATKYLSTEFFVFHFSNCYEVDGNIVIDLCALPGNTIQVLAFSNIDKINNDASLVGASGKLTRFVLPVDDIENKPLGEELLKNINDAKISREDILACASAIKQDNSNVLVNGLILSEADIELPRINYKYNMKPYTYSYAAGMTDCEKGVVNLDCLVKVNVTTGVTKIFKDLDYFCSEPVFVAAPDAKEEDDGVVLTLMLHKEELNKLSLLVLNAKDWTEMARVNFTAKGTVSATFHGQFIGSNDEIHSY